MKRTSLLLIVLTLGLFPAAAREFAVSGPEGGLAMKVEGENHLITRKKKEICAQVAAFFRGLFFAP